MIEDIKVTTTNIETVNGSNIIPNVTSKESITIHEKDVNRSVGRGVSDKILINEYRDRMKLAPMLKTVITPAILDSPTLNLNKHKMKEIKGIKNIAQIIDSMVKLINYSFLIISSATCSLPLGTRTLKEPTSDQSTILSAGNICVGNPSPSKTSFHIVAIIKLFTRI